MKHAVRTAAVTLLAAGLMAFFLRNASLEQVWTELLGARRDLLAGGMLCTVVVYLVRVERWRNLLRPIAWIRFRPALRATIIGFAVNSLIPGRVGEVVRPFVLARSEGLSGAAVFATIVLERLLDLLVICLIFGGIVAFSGPQQSAAGSALLATMRTGAAFAGLAGMGALTLAFILAADPRRAGRLSLRLRRWTPSGVAHRLAGQVERFLEGAAAACQPRSLAVAVLWSFVLWGATAMSMWYVTRAFGVDVDAGGAIVLMGLVVVGVAVPTPAGVGGYHAAYQLGATVLYAATDDQAVGAGLVLHLLSFGPVTVLGLVFMAQDGLRFANMRGLANGAPAAAAARQPGAALRVPARTEDRSLS